MGRILLFIGFFALAAGAAGPAAGQCSLVSGPTAITCPDTDVGCYSAMWLVQRPYSISLYQNGVGGQDRLMMPLNYGHVVYGLANPGSPAYLAVGDIRLPPVGPIGGDGQSFIAGVGVSGDGQRALLTMDVTNTGGTQVGKPSPAAFKPAASTGVYRSSRGLVVQKNGSRYIGYGLNTGGNLWAVDATTLPGSYSSITYESAFSGLTSGATALRLAEGNGFQYVYWARNNGTVVLADASNPGPNGSITGSMPTWSIPLVGWGRPAGDSLKSASAAVDPQSPQGNLYILGAFQSSSGVVGFSLLKFNRTTGLTTAAGTFAPDAGYRVNPGGRLVLAQANSYSNGVDLFMWTSSAGPTSNGPKGILRLYVTSAPNFGTPISQTVDFDKNLPGTPQISNDMAVLRKSATDVYAYIVDTTVAVAVRMDCQRGPAPAAGHLAVSNTSTGTTLASGDVVFVGDTLQIAPSITPPNAVEAMDNWNLDLDYHSAEHGSIGFFQLLNPDACFTSCANQYPGKPDPPQFTMVGPCDPLNPFGGNPATGAGCWNSVVANGDFPAVPPPGATRTQSIAFEAKNIDPDTTSPVPLATFAVTWKVPAVKVQNLSALLDVSSKATFQDASEGHPLAWGYKWYFGSNPAAPSSETLTLDGACSGPSCQHAFPGNGTYNAWLTASYAGGYASPACGHPCTLPKSGSFIVNVTDFVAAFTAPSTALVGGSPIHVTNQSVFGSGITPTYSYNLCNATTGSCPEGSWSALSGSGPWDIPVPSPAAPYWLRMKATYNGGTGTAYWLPNVEADPAAWEITVNSAPPSVTLTVDPNPSNVGSPVSFTASASGFAGTVSTSSYSWTFGDTATQSGGSLASHIYLLSGTYMVRCTVTDSLGNTMDAVRVVMANGTLPPLAVSVGANPSPSTPNTSVSFTASPSGGSGIYTNYVWSFGDGSPLSPGATPSTSHAYSAVGTYTASCTVTDSAASQASGTTTVVVQCPAVTAVATSNSAVCAGQTLQLDASAASGAAYSWTGPNGFTSNLRNPAIGAVTSANAGSYTVIMTVNGCSAPPARTTVVVNPRPATPVITAPSVVGATSPNRTASAPNHAGASYVWMVGNGTITAGQGTAQITFTAGTAGTALTLSVTETNTSGCASAQGDATVTVAPAGSAALFYTMTPCRVIDTRDPTGPLSGPSLQSGRTRTFDVVASACGIPAGAKALSTNFSATQGTAPGDLVIYPGNEPQPTASNITFAAGKTLANNGILNLAADGSGTIKVHANTSGTVDLILDVNGYFQ